MIPRTALPAILVLCASVSPSCAAENDVNITIQATSAALRNGIVAEITPNVAVAALPQSAGGTSAVKTTGGSSMSASGKQPPNMANFTAHITTFTPQWLWLEAIMPQLSHLLTGLSFAAIVKILCMAGNVLVQVSPYPQVKRWENRGCTGEADAAPYVSIMFGGWQWCFYGMFAWLQTGRSGFLILVQSNCLGAFLGTYYMVAFYRHCRNEDSLNSLHRYLSAVTSMALFQMCAMFVLPPERALFLTGLISSFCSFVGAISMLVTLPAVLRSKDSRSIPGPLVTANFLCALVWCVCGWLLDDPLVMGPNIVAVLSSASCIYFKIHFPSDCKGDELEEQQDTANVPLSSFNVDKKGHTLASEFTPISAPVPRYLGPVSTSTAGSNEATQCADGTGGTF